MESADQPGSAAGECAAIGEEPATAATPPLPRIGSGATTLGPRIALLGAVAAFVLVSTANFETKAGTFLPSSFEREEKEVEGMSLRSTRRHRSNRTRNRSRPDLPIPGEDSALVPSNSKPRVAPRAPHRVYTCGYGNLFSNPESSVAKALFPDANVTYLHSLNVAEPFQDDDVLLYPCGGPCPIKPHEMATTFPGTILTVNGESVSWKCNVGPKDTAEDRNRIIPLDFIDSDPQYYNTTTTYVLAIDAASRPLDVRRRILDPAYRAHNTGEHFLIYAASNCVGYRDDAFRRLSQVGSVHYGGRCNGRGVGQFSPEVSQGGWGENHYLFAKYRFALAMENTNTPHYVTEKIANAFLAGSVPIYYGPDDVFEIFNREAFVFYDINNPEPALQRIAYLESNATAYAEVTRQPVLAHGENTVARYFSLRDSEGHGQLKWAIRERLGFG